MVREDDTGDEAGAKLVGAQSKGRTHGEGQRHGETTQQTQSSKQEDTRRRNEEVKTFAARPAGEAGPAE